MKFGLVEELLEVVASVEMKYSHEHWRLQAFITIVMYLAIRRYDDQAFDDMSKENEKKLYH